MRRRTTSNDPKKSSKTKQRFLAFSMFCRLESGGVGKPPAHSSVPDQLGAACGDITPGKTSCSRCDATREFLGIPFHVVLAVPCASEAAIDPKAGEPLTRLRAHQVLAHSRLIRVVRPPNTTPNEALISGHIQHSQHYSFHINSRLHSVQ